jgi:citrate lyase subunit beta/citryl-CoA lyase
MTWARKVLAAARNQRGVFELDGKMVDMPVLRRAERIIRNGGDEPRE